MKKDIIIYGAGNYGKIIHSFLKNFGETNVLCFLETKIEEEKFYEGVPILSVDMLLQCSTEKILILLAIKDSIICNNVRMKLVGEYGIRNRQIILCADFILANNLDILRKRFCICCAQYMENFLPSGVKQPIFKKYHIIGGGYRGNCICKNCGSSDRERWFYYVLKKYTSIFSDMCSVLHFAPEKQISKIIAKENAACQYVTADIVVGRAQYVIDMTDIRFENNLFDYVIANHVLEHIPDEQMAVSEIKRVLKRNGKILLSFPVCLDLDTLEDKTLVTADQRLKAYGQTDHVRLYGRDYKPYFEKFGLDVEVFSPYMEFSDEEIEEMGFIRNDIIIMCSIKSCEENK